MKKIALTLLIFSLFSCEKKEVTKKLDLNGTFEGTISGWAQPTSFSGTTSWVMTHQGNDVTAKVTNQVSSGFTGAFSVLGTFANDSTINGFIPEFQGYKVVLIVKKDLNTLTFESGDNPDANLRVRFKGTITRK